MTGCTQKSTFPISNDRNYFFLDVRMGGHAEEREQPLNGIIGI